MNVQKLNGILRNFDLIKHDFSSNTKRKNYFLCTCIDLDPNINLKEMNQKFPFGGLIGHGNSCMDYFFANSKIFRLHAILHDAAGSVTSTTYKGPGYCYVLPRFPSSCFLGHVTGLIFCLYVINFCFISICIVRLLVILTKIFSENSYHHESSCFGY